MSQIHEQHFGPIPDNARCTICDAPARGMWFGKNANVQVCPECALNHLPRLMADAVVNDQLPPAVHVERIERVFLHGLVCRLQRTVRQLKGRGESPSQN